MDALATARSSTAAHQLRHTAISFRVADAYTEVDLKRFSGHRSLLSLERYSAENREAAKRKI